MHASDFEFRHRFWLIFGLYGVAFASYGFDRQNVVVAVLRRLAPALGARSAALLPHAVFGAGAALVFAAAALRTWASAYLRSEVVHDLELRTEGLVADGPYRHLRNPLYLGNIVMAIGFGLMASTTGCLLLVGGTLFFILRLIGREEAALRVAQADRYRAFTAAVPRLWPALRPRLPASGLPPRWAQAWAGEAFFWVLAAAAIVFAVTFDMRFFMLAVALGFAADWLRELLTRRTRRRQGGADPG
ncbi:MAG TPA: methyltransferase [Thermoanaerobaculia bacterium]|nr:methyltransferase [Thermoanaerobaculia bacterium]